MRLSLYVKETLLPQLLLKTGSTLGLSRMKDAHPNGKLSLCRLLSERPWDPGGSLQDVALTRTGQRVCTRGAVMALALNVESMFLKVIFSRFPLPFQPIPTPRP